MATLIFRIKTTNITDKVPEVFTKKETSVANVKIRSSYEDFMNKHEIYDRVPLKGKETYYENKKGGAYLFSRFQISYKIDLVEYTEVVYTFLDSIPQAFLNELHILHFLLGYDIISEEESRFAA